MAGRKKPRSVLRNMVIVFAVFVPVLAVVLYARTINREVVLILPEERAARDAQRTAPENGFPMLLEAAKLLPTRPAPVGDGSSERGDNPWEEPGLSSRQAPSLARLLLIALKDDDAQVIQYARECAPAAAKVREALAKPFFMLPEAREFRDNTYEPEILNLGRGMIALGRVQFEETPSEESLTPLLDSIRMIRALCRNELLLSWADVLEGTALQQLRAMGDDPARQVPIKAALEKLGPGYLPRREVLHVMLLHMDDQLARKQIGENMRPDRRFFRGAFAYDLQRIAMTLKPHVAELYDMADSSPSGLDAWLYKNAKPGRGPDDPFGMLRRINMSLWRAGGLTSDFEGTKVAIALAAFRAETGAYPKSLDELAPKYLAAAPIDPWNGKPFGYKLTGDDAFVLYSPGIDNVDSGGSPRSDRVIASKNLAAEAESSRNLGTRN